MKPVYLVCLLAPLVLLAAWLPNTDSIKQKKIDLGKQIFFDKNLSDPPGLSCASCHDPITGFSDPFKRAFSEGAVPGRFVNRNAPSLGYISYCPPLHFNEDSDCIGGFFLDGRANSLEEQASGPLLNHLEMNNSDMPFVYQKMRTAAYAGLFKEVFGPKSLDDTTAMQYAFQAIAEFERSENLNAFTSKYDYYLKGKAKLTEQEMRGLQLFNDTARAKCANCHPSTPDAELGVVLFTDYTYDNLGLPHNPASPDKKPDLGLGAFLKNPAMDGQFKVPTLRNVELSAPYFHNAFFNTLEDAVRFYSERDVSSRYPAPEVNENVNHDELGDLKLTEQEIKDIVAFLKTLTDGYKPQ